MSELGMINDPIKKLLDDATWQTAMIFKDTVTREQLIEFRRYLEDSVLFDIISCGRSFVGFASEKNFVTDNLRVALIASGISRNGTIPNGAEYTKESLVLNRNTHIFAKKRARELDFERLGTTYINRVVAMSDNLRRFKNSINAGELVELGLALKERDCGYIEDDQRLTDFARGAQFVNWCQEEECFKRAGLTNTLAYDICKYVYSYSPNGRHYPLTTTLALKQMADIDLYVSLNGIENYDNNEVLEDTLRKIEAAKLTDRELIAPFERKFKDNMRFYIHGNKINNNRLSSGPEKKLINKGKCIPYPKY